MSKEIIIPVSDSIYLDLIKEADKSILITYMNDEDIYKNTMKVPSPYVEKDADFWVNLVYSDIEKHGVQTNWAIRDQSGALLGGIGLVNQAPSTSHKNEMGYWVAKPFRNKGIMSQVIDAFGRFCHQEFKIVRLEANVFSFNKASARVLEKIGYQREGYLRKSYFKDGQYLDGILYAKIFE